MRKLNNWYKNLSEEKKGLIFYIGLFISLPAVTALSLLIGKLVS